MLDDVVLGQVQTPHLSGALKQYTVKTRLQKRSASISEQQFLKSGEIDSGILG